MSAVATDVRRNGACEEEPLTLTETVVRLSPGMKSAIKDVRCGVLDLYFRLEEVNRGVCAESALEMAKDALHDATAALIHLEGDVDEISGWTDQEEATQ